MSLNKVMIIGNAGKDPEVVAFQDGSRMAKLTLAATEKYTDRNGQRQQQTEWFNVVINGKSVDVAEKYVRKGSQIYVEGKLRTRKYQAQDGSERYVTEVLCQSLQLLGSAPQGQQQQAAPQPYPPQGYAQQPQPQRQARCLCLRLRFSSRHSLSNSSSNSSRTLRRVSRSSKTMPPPRQTGICPFRR